VHHLGLNKYTEDLEANLDITAITMYVLTKIYKELAKGTIARKITKTG